MYRAGYFAVLIAALVTLPWACAKDDDPPPRQDGWLFYAHPDGPLYDRAISVAIDQAGGMWIGQQFGSSSYLDDSGTPLDTSDDSWMRFETSDGLCGTGGVRVYMGPNGGLWFAGNMGICYLDHNGTPLDKSDDTWTDVFTVADGMRDTSDREAFDGLGGVWILYSDQGADYLDYNGTPADKSDDTWVHYGPLDGMGDIGGTSVTLEPGKGVWFGHFNGVDFLDYGGTPLFKGDDTWVNFTMSDGLSVPVVTSLAIDSAGLKWIGTWTVLNCLDDNGTPLDKGDDRWMEFQPWGLNFPFSIAIDQFGAKWVGTQRNGIFYLDDAGTPFDRSDDRSYFSRRENGLPSNWVYSIILDAANGKWVGTTEGLCYLP